MKPPATISQIALGTALSIGLAFGPASAAERSPQNQDISNQQDQIRVSGIVTKVQKTTIGEDDHRILRIKIRDGQERLIDLGLMSDSRTIQVDQGDRIQVSGIQSQVDGKQVLQAERIKVRATNQQDRMAKAEGRRIQGPIQKVKDLDDEGGFLVKVRCEDDCSKLVRLPSDLKVSTQELRNAEAICVIGQKTTHDGNQVLRAEKVKLFDKADRSERQRDHMSQRGAQHKPGGNRNQPISQDRDRSGVARIQGVLEGAKRLRNKSGTQDRQLVRLRMQDGDSAVVDLGQTSDARLLRLDRGDQMQVIGQRKQIAGRDVIVARRIKILDDNQRSRYFNRDSQADRSDSQLPKASRFSIDGRVTGVKTVKVSPKGQELKLLKVQMRDGKSAILNIRPVLNRSVLQIDRGDSISAFGNVERFKGKKIHLVDAIMVTDRQQPDEDFANSPTRDERRTGRNSD